MNTNTLKGNWMIFKGKVKEKWGQLTDDELDVAEGQVEQIAGHVTRRYGIVQDEARKQLKQLQQDCGCS